MDGNSRLHDCYIKVNRIENEKRKILIVEDDEDLRNIISIYLKGADYEPFLAENAKRALELTSVQTFDLILLDMMLPDETGDVVCRKFRENSLFCPIIFISCLDDDETILRAFSMGADDYVTKPLSVKMLLARINANIRRAKVYKPGQVEQKPFKTQFRRFTIDPVQRTAAYLGKNIGLSPIEYDILLYLSQHPDKLLLYNDIYSNVWQNESFGDFRTVMVHISNLRKKMDNDPNGIISNVRGAGYIFTDK